MTWEKALKGSRPPVWELLQYENKDNIFVLISDNRDDSFRRWDKILTFINYISSKIIYWKNVKKWFSQEMVFSRNGFFKKLNSKIEFKTLLLFLGLPNQTTKMKAKESRRKEKFHTTEKTQPAHQRLSKLLFESDPHIV